MRTWTDVATLPTLVYRLLITLPAIVLKKRQGTIPYSKLRARCVGQPSIPTMDSVAAEALIKADGPYQGAAVAGGALVLVAALYLLAEKYKTTRIQKHWEEVCRKTLQRRNSLKHKVLQSDVGDTSEVRIKDLAFAWFVRRATDVASVVAASPIKGVENMTGGVLRGAGGKIACSLCIVEAFTAKTLWSRTSNTAVQSLKWSAG